MSGSTPLESSQRNRRKTRRKAPRNTVKVEWRPGSSARGRSFPAQLLDVSEGGVRIIVSDEVTEDRVDIALTGPTLSKSIRRFARVIWALPIKEGGYCVGLAFQRNLSFAEFLQIGIQADVARKILAQQPQEEGVFAGSA